MITLKVQRTAMFDEDVLPYLNVSGDITDGELTVVLKRGKYPRDSLIVLQRKDIEALLPVFKELLEVS